MTPLVLTLLIVNLLLSGAALVIAIVSRPRSDASAGAALAEVVRGELRQSSSELRQDLSTQRTELTGQLDRDRDERQRGQGALQDALREQLLQLRTDNEARLEKIREAVGEKLQGTLSTALRENSDRIEALSRSNAEKHLELQLQLRGELDKIRQSNEAKHLELQSSLRAEMDKLRTGNEQKLEQMRATVDEKLQGTLEKRLGESFTLVSTRLEEVQKGLGEMQTLAQDVGGLKRVLTNVKSRGGWGEVQLSRQLEDLLTAEQYDENVAIRPGSGERVEFAVHLPGRDDAGTPVYLPIDSKFPQEDYERLLNAQDGGEKSEIAEAERSLERAILEQAKLIAGKYIEPPYSTDFAIMYLPTEGLFAEVVRRPGLANRLQTELRVQITGPTTLTALLNSLQLGFRTLAIEKRSSEVWQVLSAAKAEFQKYGQVWSKLEKQLQTAQNTVSEAGRRTRAVERKLRSVESPEILAEPAVLAEELFAELDEAEAGPLDDFATENE